MRLKSFYLFVLAVLVSVDLLSQIKTIPVITHVVCVGNTNGSVVLTTSGGTSPYTYTWQPGGTNSSSITSQGVGNYSVTIKDASTNSLTANYNIGYKVCWQNMYPGTIVSGDDLVQNRSDMGNNWLQTGNSSNILHGNTDGWVEYVATTASQHKIIGLLDSASGSAYNNIDFGIYLKNDGTLNTMNNGSQSYITTYTVGSVIRVERVGSTVNYKKDGATIWTTSITTAMQQSRLTVRGAIWTYGGRLEKVGCSFASVNAGASVSNVITCSVTTASLTANTNVSGGTFSWTPNGSAPTGSTTVVSSGGTYTLAVTNPTNSCIATTTIAVVANNSPPNVNAGPDKIIGCSMTTVTLNGSSGTSGVTFSWTPGGSTPTNSTTVVSSAGTYTLKVTNPANSCVATATVGVTNNTTPPNANAGPNRAFGCGATTLTLLGSSTTSPVTYSWTAGGSTPTNSTTVVSSTGTYTLKVTNTANNCSATSTVLVTNNSTLPNVSAGSNKTITCNPATGVLNGSSSTSGVTFSWTPGGSTPTNSTTVPSTTGTYTLKVTDPFNTCSATATVSVASNTTTPNVSAGSNKTLTCVPSTVTLNGSSSTSGVTFSWTPGGTTPTNSTTAVSAPGTYSLKVTNPVNSCTAVATVVVSNTVAPNVSAGGTKYIYCYNPSPILNGSSTTSGVTYSWNPGGTTPTNSTTAVSAPGNYTLTVTITATGCKASSWVNVILQPFPIINPPYILYTLSGMPFTLGAVPTVSNMTSPVDYDWTKVGGGFSSTLANPVVSGITSNATYSLNAMDINDCMVSHTFQVIVMTPNSYAKLDKKINAGHYEVYNGKLYFAFYEEYRDLSQLSYKIYDDHRKLRLDPSVTAWAGAVKLGDNRYVIDLSAPGIGFSSADNGKFFVMEVTNEKQELVQVKFKYAQ